MSKRTTASWLLAAVLLVAGPVRAVDPALHDDPAFAPTDPFAVPPAARSAADAAALDAGAIEGVEIREIRDLGARRDAPAPQDLWQRMRGGFALAGLDSPVVVERQAWYSQRPEQLHIMVERSRRYLFHIVEEIEKRGMPTELALLPMVESAYNPLAYSRAHASGLWQFIPSTGRNYNLEQNWWYDARRDIVASTNAALDYLQTLYEMFGDWHLALAAYNMGENGLARAIERNQARGLPTGYASVPMPNETRRYVPSLVALRNIIADPAAFGVELDPIPNAPYFVTVSLTRDIDVKLAAKLAEMPVEEFVALNPGHNRPLVSSAVAPQLVLPADRAEVFVRNLDSHAKPLSSWSVHTFKSSDRLEKLAAERGVSVAQLRAANGLGPRTNVKPGQQLLLPKKGSAAASEALPPIFRPPVQTASTKAGKSVRKARAAAKAPSAKAAAAKAPAARAVAAKKAPARAAAKPAQKAPAAPTQVARRSSSS